MDYFNSFNISLIPQENNKKVESLAVATSLLNSDDFENQSTFCVNTIIFLQYLIIENIGKFLKIMNILQTSS